MVIFPRFFSHVKCLCVDLNGRWWFRFRVEVKSWPLD
jgi:hypothetical protein